MQPIHASNASKIFISKLAKTWKGTGNSSKNVCFFSLPDGLTPVTSPVFMGYHPSSASSFSQWPTVENNAAKPQWNPAPTSHLTYSFISKIDKKHHMAMSSTSSTSSKSPPSWLQPISVELSKSSSNYLRCAFSIYVSLIHPLSSTFQHFFLPLNPPTPSPTPQAQAPPRAAGHFWLPAALWAAHPSSRRL